MSSRLSVALAFFALVVATPPSTHAWQRALLDTPGASRPFGITVDAAGDVIVVGRAVTTGDDDGELLAKLAGDKGTVLWQTISNIGTAKGSDVLRTVATDAARNVVAVGQVLNTATAGDLLVVRTSATGTPLWRKEIDGGNKTEDDALAVAVDASGAVLVAGQATPQGVANSRFTVLKLAPANGNASWQKTLAEASGSARAIVVDGTAVYAAGDAGGKIVVVRFADSDGAQTWRADLVGPASGSHVGRTLAVGGGRVIVAGHVPSTTDAPDFAVIALNATTGGEVWRYTLDGSATDTADTDDAFGVVVDPAGDVIAAGRLGNTGTDDDAVVVKLAGATGAERWRVTLNGNNSNDDVAQAIALDGDDVFVTGTIRNRNTRADALLARLDGSTGAETWRLALNGSENDADAGFAIAAAGGHVVAATRIRDGGAVGSVAVVKRTGANGGDFPCGDGHEDAGEDCDDGNLTAGDGCRADCTAEVCGDGIHDPQEGCDDRNLDAGDCCSATCTLEADDSPCDDADACTVGNHCSAGACAATANVVCEPTDPCDRATCDPASGVCGHVRAAEGALCDDANACTPLDRCIGGVCTGTGTRTCRDDDPCTADSCVPSVGCDFPAMTGLPSLTCLFERTTIETGCPAGVARQISKPLDHARKVILAVSTATRTRKIRRGLGRARKDLKHAIRALEKRRAQLEPNCAAALERALGDLAARIDPVRGSLL